MEDLDDIRVLWDLYFRDDDVRTARIASLYGYGPENNYGLEGVGDHDIEEAKNDSNSVGNGGEDDGDITERGVTDLEAMDSEVDENETDLRHRKRQAMAGTWTPPVFSMQRWRWDFGPEFDLR